MQTLFDRDALTRKRAKADPKALFLHEEAASEIKERLQTVNKSFNQVAIITAFPQIWTDRLPNARIVADQDLLDLGTGLDLVIHAGGLHWANDPVGQLIQSRRALKPDGLFLGVMCGGQTLHELRACLAEAEIAQTGGLSPRVAPMAEIRDLGGLLQRAGFALPVADSDQIATSYESVFHLMRDLRAMGETNVLIDRMPHFTRRAVMLDTEHRYRAAFAQGDRLIATYELIYLTGWAPDESQPQPLRPGSATARLADALGTGETKLRD